MKWAPDPTALDLLDRAGPFESEGYRSACVATLGGARDVSFAASAADGTIAAVALVRRHHTAYIPYGYSGVRASRQLDAGEVRALLHAARRASGAQRLIIHDVFEPTAGGRRVGDTQFVYLERPPDERITKRGRQSIRRATRAGAVCEETPNPGVFCELYANASKSWGVTYPLDLIAATAEQGVGLFFDVRIDGRPVGSLAVLRGVTHWMYWLAAQNDEGRQAEVGYLAVATMLNAARAAATKAVNLGASASLPGVARFKERLGGVESPVLAWSDSSALGTLAGISHALLARRRRT